MVVFVRNSLYKIATALGAAKVVLSTIWGCTELRIGDSKANLDAEPHSEVHSAASFKTSQNERKNVFLHAEVLQLFLSENKSSKLVEMYFRKVLQQILCNIQSKAYTNHDMPLMTIMSQLAMAKNNFLN